MASLGDRLGIRLFRRTTRSVALTEEGRRYLERCRAALVELDAGEAELDDGTERVAGLIRLGAPVAFGRLHVVPHLHSFAETHPDVCFDVRLSDRVVDPLQARLDHVFERSGERVVLPACDRLRCDDAEGVLAAAVAGMGLCYLPTFLARPAVDAGRLLPVLSEWAIDRYPVHLLTPSPTRVPRRIVRLVDHLIAKSHRESIARRPA